jgi:hypothetical protein
MAFVFHGVRNGAPSCFVHNAHHQVEARVACTLAVGAEERIIKPSSRVPMEELRVHVWRERGPGGFMRARESRNRRRLPPAF